MTKLNSNAIALFTVGGSLLFFAIIAVALRIYVRIWIVKSFGLDDYLMVFALILYAAAESMLFAGMGMVSGKDIIGLYHIMSPALKIIYVAEIHYVACVSILKVSVAVFLLRLLQNPIHRKIIWITLIIVSLYSTGYIFSVIFQCKPIRYFWEPLTTKGKCVRPDIYPKLSYTHAILIGGSDIIYSILPLLMLWNLQMKRSLKIICGSLLCLGFLAGITTFVRIRYLKSLALENMLNFVTSTSKLAIWTCAEPGVGICVGSIATLRPLLRIIKFDTQPTPPEPSISTTIERNRERIHREARRPKNTSYGESVEELALEEIKREESV